MLPMNKRVLVALTFIALLAFPLMIQPVKVSADNTPYLSGPMAYVTIQKDGTGSGTSTIMQNGDYYTFTSDIKGIMTVYRNNVVIDGAGYTLAGEGSLGTGSFYGLDNKTGVSLLYATGVTIKNLHIENHVLGISPTQNAIITGDTIEYNHVGIAEPSTSTISNNYIAYNQEGISSGSQSNKGNKITGNTFVGNNVGVNIMTISKTGDVISNNNFTRNGASSITLGGCSGVTVSNNIITETTPGIGLNVTAGPMGAGIVFISAHDNQIFGNYIADNTYGLTFASNSNNNVIYDNDFVNSEVVAIPTGGGASKLNGATEVWDKDSSGNYWSDYLSRYPSAAEVGNSGIGDLPYSIDQSNMDHYPLLSPKHTPAKTEAETSPVLTVRPLLVDQQIQLDGSLSYRGIGIPATLTLSYSNDSGTTWTQISTVTTDTEGAYSALWVPQATGTIQLKVSWIGNSSIPQTSNTIYVIIEPNQRNDLISVASNSTITLFSFNIDKHELNFNVTGPSGTTGYVKVYISKTLFENITDASVTLDGNQLDYVTSSNEDSWILYFEYSHSTHAVTINLDVSNVPASFDIPVILVAVLLIISGVSGLLIFFARRTNEIPQN